MVPTARRSGAQRLRIQDTTALSLFIQEPSAERGGIGGGGGRGRRARMQPAAAAAAHEPILRPKSVPIARQQAQQLAPLGEPLKRSPSQVSSTTM